LKTRTTWVISPLCAINYFSILADSLQPQSIITDKIIIDLSDIGIKDIEFPLQKGFDGPRSGLLPVQHSLVDPFFNTGHFNRLATVGAICAWV
jgi:hypothetical protein